MIEENNFETYLSISKNKYEIYLIDKNNFKNIYKNEIIINNDIFNYEFLNKFLNNNIFKIEKLVGKFVNNIFVILEDKKILKVTIGIKNKNYIKNTNQNYLENTLRETKELFKNHYQEKIMHMIVDSYLINGKSFNSFEKDLISKEFCLVINFISIPNNFSHQIEKTLEKYQIKVNRFIDKSYIVNFFKDEEIEYPLMIYKILSGINENEVQLVPKNKEKKGFFEKFFQLFS